MTGRPFALGLGVSFGGKPVGEFEDVDEAGLLVEATKVIALFSITLKAVWDSPFYFA